MALSDPLDDYAQQPSRPDQPRKRAGRPAEFIRGPLPLEWFSVAAGLTGSALVVALAVWFRAGIERSTTVTLFPSAVGKFGLSRWSAYRGLDALEEAGLVSIERHRGRSPVVTIQKSENICNGSKRK